MATAHRLVAAISAAALSIIGGTIALEGGYVNHPNDPGGRTNMGITESVARKHGYIGHMRDLPRETAESIYYADYFVKPGLVPILEVNPPVAAELFDTAVNMGPARPSRWFQQAVNAECGTRLTVDGRIGPQTQKAFADCQVTYGPNYICRRFVTRLDQYQLAEYQRLVRVNPRLKVFYKGWTNHRIGNVDLSECPE